jgi:hypothetical protein
VRKPPSEGEAEPARESPDFLTALDLPDPAMVGVARSLLEGAGIPFFIKNEGTQGLFGWGQMGTGYNLIIGPPALMVETSRLEEVRELLDPLFRGAVPQPEDEDK